MTDSRDSADDDRSGDAGLVERCKTGATEAVGVVIDGILNGL